MSSSLLLSRSNLLTFLTCRRRFQLQTLERLAWPDMALDLKQQETVQQGNYFHRILERHFLGLPVDPLTFPNQQLQDWWQLFQQQGPKLPEGRRLPELRLTVPVGAHFLIGRFDLLIIEAGSSTPKAHIYDWKTSRPRPLSELETDWQSRLYLAMAASSGHALLEIERSLNAENITLTYWYTADPQTPRQITYSQAGHEKKWAEIETIVQEIEDCLAEENWPLTANWSECRSCPYQAYCGRWESGRHERVIAEERAGFGTDWDFLLEPESP